MRHRTAPGDSKKYRPLHPQPARPAARRAICQACKQLFASSGGIPGLIRQTSSSSFSSTVSQNNVSGFFRRHKNLTSRLWCSKCFLRFMCAANCWLGHLFVTSTLVATFTSAICGENMVQQRSCYCRCFYTYTYLFRFTKRWRCLHQCNKCWGNTWCPCSCLPYIQNAWKPKPTNCRGERKLFQSYDVWK